MIAPGALYVSGRTLVAILFGRRKRRGLAQR